MIVATITDVVTLARAYADERVIGYLTDAEAREYVTEEWVSTVWPQIVQHGDSWYATTATSGVTSGSSVVGTPSDLHRAKRMILVWGTNDREEVLPLTERELPQIASCSWSRYGPKRYVLQGSSCQILPEPTETVDVQWTYLPSPSSTSVVGPEGVKKATALAAAIAMRGMQDEDESSLVRRYEQAMVALARNAGQRYHDEGPRIVDTYPEGDPLSEEFYLPRA